MKKITVVLLLVAAILLAACGGGAQTGGTTPGTAPGASPGTAPGASSGSSSGAAAPSQALPTPTETETEKIADSMTYAGFNASWDLSPWKQEGSSADTIGPMLWAGLMVSQHFATPLDEMQYDMAKSVTFSADKLTATIELYDYIHDSKGNPIKADDVVFSYNMAPTMNSKVSHVGQLESLVATGEYTVEMKVGTVGAGVWENMLGYCLVVSQKWYEGASDAERSNDPATTGAYRVAENVPGTSITIEAIEDYWQVEELRNDVRKQNVKTITLVCIVEDGMRSIALENGEIDSAKIAAFDIDKYIGNPDYNIFSVLHGNVTNLIFNCAPGSVLDNAALRKAILHAVDYDQVRMAGQGHPNFGVAGNDTGHPLASDFDPAWNNEPYFEFDVNKALQLMDEAGYGANSGLKLRFMCKNHPYQMAGAAVIQSYLSAIGIDVEILAFDTALYNTYLREQGEWDFIWLIAGATSGLVLDSWNYYFGNWSGNGTVGFVQDAKLQELLEKAIQIHDKASLNAFRDYVNEQGYGRNMYTEDLLYVSQPGITNMKGNFQSNPALNETSFASDYQSNVR